MSHYDEDWQRRKEYLTRTLFHDIPYTVLSPIPEESRQSSEAQVLSGSSQSSVSHHSEESYLSYEEQQTSVSKDRSERISRELGRLGLVSSNTEVTTTETRCYSPLPPLIIEVEPNKHDEPEEYYERLLVKIRKIYRNMFLKSKHLNEDNFSESDLEDVIEEKDWRSDSSSYNGDLDSASDTGEDTNIIKNNNFANLPRAESDVREFVEDDADMESDDSETAGSNDENELVDCDMNEMDRESRTSVGDPTFSQVTFEADIHNDGIPIPEITPSPVYEVPLIEVTQSLVQRIPCDGIGSGELETQKHDLTTVLGDITSQRERMLSQIIEDRTTDPRQTPLEEPHYEVSLGLNVDDFIRSPILQSHTQFEKPSETVTGVRTLLQDNQDDFYTYKNKQDSLFEQRMRREMGERFLPVRGNSAMLEHHQDSEPLTSIVEEYNYYTRELEVMRSHKLDERTKSLPMQTTRHSSLTDVSGNHNIVPPKISDVTASSKDANISSRQEISNDIHELLNTTVNISPEVNRQSVTSDTVSSQNSGSRKRKFQDISVQTQNVSWSELRNNFFVGTPKIFKICSCVGHNCL